MIAAATERRNERCAQVRPEVVCNVLDQHPTAGEDQAAMVQDVCRSGAGVVLVVGRAGSGKTWTLGLAREAFQLDGYRALGCAPTGIATVGLGEEGFSEIGTVDRLLLDLGQNTLELDTRTVLVVDEAAMVGTRKPNGPAARWCWSGMTASSPRLPPVAASAPCACAWAPRS